MKSKYSRNNSFKPTSAGNKIFSTTRQSPHCQESELNINESRAVLMNCQVFLFSGNRKLLLFLSSGVSDWLLSVRLRCWSLTSPVWTAGWVPTYISNFKLNLVNNVRNFLNENWNILDQTFRFIFVLWNWVPVIECSVQRNVLRVSPVVTHT